MMTKNNKKEMKMAKNFCNKRKINKICKKFGNKSKKCTNQKRRCK